MTKQKKSQKKAPARYKVELNDWATGFMIVDTKTHVEIDAPANETVNLCIAEMNRLAANIDKLLTAGDALDAYLNRQDGTTNGMLACRREWLDAKERASQ